jgi:hypothetical protein
VDKREADETIRGFFKQYDAIWTAGIPERKQAAYVQKVMAGREAERRRQQGTEDMREVLELTTLLTQEHVALTDEQRHSLEEKREAAWARLRARAQGQGQGQGQEADVWPGGPDPNADIHADLARSAQARRDAGV